MLSRVANSVYWMSRYLERAENIARFIDVNLHQILDVSFPEENQWEPLVEITGDKALFQTRFKKATAENVLEFLTFDPGYPSSIYSCICSARENARTIREIISTEMFEEVNRFYWLFKDENTSRRSLEDPHDFYEEIKTHHQLFTGLWEGTMSHGEAWHFMNLGRMLERADKTSRILDAKYFMLLPQVDYVGSAYDDLQWAALLKSISGLEMYRKEFQHINPKHVAGFLIFNGNFPRAVRYCIAQGEYSLHRITGTPLGTYQNAAEQKMGRLRSDLEFSNIDEVIAKGLHEYIDHLQIGFNEVGDAIHQIFFANKQFPTQTYREASQ